ncbi:hypothetical protein LPJ64_004702 [Coemansia asiatica]|uniref:Uncharacterized protein n=1 Tax=Coemansia asiatica TaxID=1052880 RepID=A0A9W7XHU1_9FUNG|nr:hypothetical protein LPJ64_004702 [Coemansia asiatica]
MTNASILANRDARNRIILGTLGFGAIGGAIGLNIAILRNLQPIARHTLTMAANWSLTGLFFLTTREALLLEQHTSRRPTFSVAREHDQMFSSVLAGGLTGGILNFVARGNKKAFVSGALGFSVLAAGGQCLFTLANRKRQQIIVDRIMAENKSLQQEQESVLADESNSLVARLRRALSVDPITLLPEWFPLRRIPSDEYREILELRKEEIRFKLSRLRGIVDDMDRREQALLRKLTETKP